MEEDKKKRKNKNKKKNKQQQQAKVAVATPAPAAAVDDIGSSNAGETSSQDQNLVEERDNSNTDFGTVNGGLEVEVKAGNNNKNNGNHDCSVSFETEKQKWLQEEAKLKTILKQLLYEKDSCMQVQADLGSKNKQLQCENDSLQEKEVSLKQRIAQVVQEKADVSLKEENLRKNIRQIEEEKVILVENEISSKELIAKLRNENASLSMQVQELEGARNSLSEENKQLLDRISTLDYKIQDLERTIPSAEVGQKDGSDIEDLKAQIDETWTFVEKLVTENAELVEKLSELYMELNRYRSVPDETSMAVPDFVAVPRPGPVEAIPSSSRSTKHFETVPIGEVQQMTIVMDSDYDNAGRDFSETTASGEIVQIPLDEHEVQDLEAQSSLTEINDGVPLTDAPLIGAPFRLIGFFAKYVSGADLVNKSSSDSLQ